MTEGDYDRTEYESNSEIERRDTGIRILLTILFALIASVVETILSVIVLFTLIWALVTRQAPSNRVRALANRIVTYYYRIGRYVTYNETQVPFPFSDFPESFEESGWNPEAEGQRLSRSRRNEDWEMEDED